MLTRSSKRRTRIDPSVHFPHTITLKPSSRGNTIIFACINSSPPIPRGSLACLCTHLSPCHSHGAVTTRQHSTILNLQRNLRVNGSSGGMHPLPVLHILLFAR